VIASAIVGAAVAVAPAPISLGAAPASGASNSTQRPDGGPPIMPNSFSS
jgi:hypothetical protein